MPWWRKKTHDVVVPSPQTAQTVHGIQCPLPLQTNLTLKDFHIVRAIGHGSTSTIFEAVHIQSSTKCVIKICMKTRLRIQDERRLRREINIHSTLMHPNILRLYACFEDDHAFYLVLEHAMKGDLLSYIRKECGGCMEIMNFKKRVLIPLLMAIYYLKKRNVLHRDIKPENILVDEDDNIKLCDFGFAINCYEERPKSIVGTLEYMAPELILGKADVFSDRIDIWAIGVLTYECIIGVSPFYHEVESEISKSIVQCSYTIPPSFPSELVQFIQCILQPSPDDRPCVQTLLRHPFLSYQPDALPSHRRSISI